MAALLQAALPPLPLGYVYAQDLRRALLPTTLMVGGSVAFVLGTVEIIDWTNEDRSPVLLYAGFGAMIVGYVYGIVGAADATRDRNIRLRRASVTIEAPPSQGLLGIRISLSPG